MESFRRNLFEERRGREEIEREIEIKEDGLDKGEIKGILSDFSSRCEPGKRARKRCNGWMGWNNY